MTPQHLVTLREIEHLEYRSDGQWRLAHTGYERICESRMSLDDGPSWKLTVNRCA